MAAAAIWKITKIAISPNGLTDLYEIWYADAKWVCRGPICVIVPNFIKIGQTVA